MKSLCIGASTFDISSIMDDFPKEGKKYEITTKFEMGGGTASNAACLLGKWGVESFLCTAVGSDTYGDKIKKELELCTVKPDFIESNYDKDTALEFVIINKNTGSRTILNMTSEDKASHVKKTEINIEPDIILMDGYEYQASSRTLNRFPNITSIMGAEKVSPEVTELSKYCKYVIASKDFAENLTKINGDFNDSSSLLNLYNAVKNRYPRNELIIMLDEKGVIYSNNNEIKVMPSLKVSVKDTTGSFDIFQGAFAYGILSNYDIEKTITFAVIAASMTTEAYGGRASIPSLNNVINVYNQKFGSSANVQVQG